MYQMTLFSNVPKQNGSSYLMYYAVLAKLAKHGNWQRRKTECHSINRLALPIVIKNGKRFRNAPKRKKQVVLTLNFDTSHLFVNQHS